MCSVKTGDRAMPSPASGELPSGRGRPDYHNPLGGIGGAAPAQSALSLRLVLAVVGLVAAAGGAVVLWWAQVPIGFVLLSGLIALSAAIDIVVVVRRKRRGESG
jgi:hypothetical protein